MYTDPTGHDYLDTDGKYHVSEITVTGSTTLNPDLIYDKIIYDNCNYLSTDGASVGNINTGNNSNSQNL